MRQMLKKFKYLFGVAGNSGMEKGKSLRYLSPHVVDLRRKWIEEIAQAVYESQRLQKGLSR